MDKVFKYSNGSLRSPPEIVYQFYPSDARKFIAGCLKRVLDKPPQWLRNLHPALQTKARHLLILELVAKFCESAEDLAAFAIAFATELYVDALSPKEVWMKLAEYKTGEIVNFYKDIGKRPPGYFANLHGFPPIHLQKAKNRLELFRSSKQLAAYLSQISDMYLALRELHNSYKHGMRVFPATDTDLRTGQKATALTYVDTTGVLKAMLFPTDSVEELYTWCVGLGDMLQTILSWHKVRLEAIERRVVTGRLAIFGKSGSSNRELRNLLFPGLFDARKAQVAKAETICMKKTGELSKMPRGDIIAVDIDSEEILPYHGPELRDVIWQAIESRPGARLVFRRITPNGKVGPY